MAIPSRQIGWSTKANLLWQISKQLERLTCVTAGGCGQTTNYNVAGCERMEYHVITYNGEGVLPEGTIVNNATPECWYIIDQTTNPADVGTVTYVWPTLGECSFCIDSHTTTTTTSTIAPTTTTTTTTALVSRQFVDVEEVLACGEACEAPFNYITVWVTYNCNENWPMVGCRVYLDQYSTTWLSPGAYNQCNGDCIQIDANGYIIGI
jgi:hypothetical protein